MNKGSAIISIIIAFIGGLAIGHLTGGGAPEGGGEVAQGEGEGGGAGAAAEGADAPERFRVPVTDQQPSKGARDALITMVVFSEFECPFCSRVKPTVDQLLADYRGKIRLVWRNNPLPFHQNAMPAAEAAMEAFAQGGADKFWAMHDVLFQNQRALSRADLERYAQQIGLDMNRFRQALDSRTHQAKIQADMQVASQIGARGTPGFFINGRQLMGAQPIDAFKTVIDDEIRRAEALRRTGIPAERIYAELTRNARTQAAPAAAPGGNQPAAPRRQPDPNAVYRVPVGDSPAKGPADALVTIVEFSEFECPFCSRVGPTLKQIVDTYGRDVRIVFKHNPLPFHQNAMPAAILAVEATQQGGAEKFWALHDILFENQRALGRPELERYAEQIGLNMARVRAALDGSTHRARVEQDQQLARSLGASGTPSFFINGRNLRGAQPFEAFKAVIDEELAKARAKVAAGTPRARVYEETIRDGATEARFIEAPGAAPGAAAAAPDADRVYNIAVPRNAPSKGGANARVTIQLFSDFECPFCSRVNPTVEQIVSTYGDRVRIVWRDYPLPFHQNAGPAAQAAREVFAQGGNAKFWAFHDLLFQNQRALSRADLERYAEQVGGINMARFRAALDANTHQAAVQADMDAVRTAGAQIGTPSFFINGRLVQGAQPFDAFKTVIDRELAGGR